MPSSRSRAVARRLALVLATLLLPTTSLHAQQPGAPVLQNGFANPGVTVAVNYGKGEHSDLLGAALAWSPGKGTFQFSAGAGRLDVDSTGFDPMTTYGLRVAFPRFGFMGGRVGMAPFIGLGGASGDSTKTLIVPIGVGAGWRMALGSTRALSLYATGTYLRTQVTPEAEGQDKQSADLLRFAAAADVTLFRNVGLTLGTEFGSAADHGATVPEGTIFGAGLSWRFR